MARKEAKRKRLRRRLRRQRQAIARAWLATMDRAEKTKAGSH